MRGLLVGGKVQDALKAAEESERKDGSGGGVDGVGVRGRGRREVRKRKYVPSFMLIISNRIICSSL